MAPPELRREIHWPVPTRTRHHEYTVTDMCYLIEAKTPCSGVRLLVCKRWIKESLWTSHCPLLLKIDIGQIPLYYKCSRRGSEAKHQPYYSHGWRAANCQRL